MTITSFLYVAITVSRILSATDGDTFVLDSGERVGPIGVDCPEALDPNNKADAITAGYGPCSRCRP